MVDWTLYACMVVVFLIGGTLYRVWKGHANDQYKTTVVVIASIFWPGTAIMLGLAGLVVGLDKLTNKLYEIF